MIVYASSCEIKTFVFPLTEVSRIRQKFECQRAATVHLAGQILPTELATKINAELVVTYMADWAHEFFGIMDGRVTEFQVAAVSPDSVVLFRWNYPVSLLTLRILLTNNERASASRCATQNRGIPSPIIWNHSRQTFEPSRIA